MSGLIGPRSKESAAGRHISRITCQATTLGGPVSGVSIGDPRPRRIDDRTLSGRPDRSLLPSHAEIEIVARLGA
jgi:hypothetical protein